MSERIRVLPNNIIRKTRGIVKTSPSSPIFGKVVDLFIVEENAGPRGDKTVVVTKDKVHFTDNYVNVYDFRMKGFRTEKASDSDEYVRGYLEREILCLKKGNNYLVVNS